MHAAAESGAYPRLKKWQGRIMASAKNESRRRRGSRVWEGWGKGQFFRFLALKWQVSFGAFWELILLHLNCLSYTHKPVSLGFGL